MKHAYFMLPLTPGRHERKAQTLCLKVVRGRDLAWPEESTITCPECVERARSVLRAWQSASMRLQSTPSADAAQREQALRTVQRVQALLGDVSPGSPPAKC